MKPGDADWGGMADVTSGFVDTSGVLGSYHPSPPSVPQGNEAREGNATQTESAKLTGDTDPGRTLGALSSTQVSERISPEAQVYTVVPSRL